MYMCVYAKCSLFLRLGTNKLSVLSGDLHSEKFTESLGVVWHFWLWLFTLTQDTGEGVW